MSRIVLVDNATLSGVERLIGESQTGNLRNTDNDIVCLEKLVTAILFSDGLICIDDYKEQYRSRRIKKFDFIGFRKIDGETYSALAKDAAEFSRSMVFAFEGSKPAGDVVSFFESLRIDPQLRWDIFVSSEYLTMSLLVRDTRNVGYEAAIDSVFRSEGANATSVYSEPDVRPNITVSGHPDIADIKELVHAFASANENYKGVSTRSLLDRMIFGYGWAAERAHFYNSVAAREGAEPYLAPLRDAFCESCCRLDAKTQISGLIETLKSKSRQAVAQVIDASGNAKFAMKLPFFTAYLISKCENPRECIEFALQLRDHSDFRDCRNILSNLGHLGARERYKEVNLILSLLEKSCTKLLKSYGVNTGAETPISLSLGLSGLSPSIDVKLSGLFAAYRNRPFTRVFRNIAQDMLSVERLGALNDKLRSSIREHRDATYPGLAVTPKFMEHRQSDSGRPAEL